LLIDLFSAASDLLEVWTENGEELLDDGVSLGEVLEYLDHILRSGKYLFVGLKVPLFDCLLLFNIFLGLIKLFLPLCEHS